MLQSKTNFELLESMKIEESDSEMSSFDFEELEEIIEEFPKAEFLNDAIMDLIDFDTVICHYPLSVE